MTSLKSLNRNDVVEVIRIICGPKCFVGVWGGGGTERELQVNICGSILNLQVRALQRPPPGVKLVIDAVCIIKGVKPKKVAGEKVSSLRISS